MREIHYSELPAEKPVLRDYLAIDRTVLANERTLLSYLRTSLSFAVVGASAIKFFDSLFYEILGVCFVVFGLMIIVVGARRFLSVRRRIEEALALDPVVARQSADPAEKESKAQPPEPPTTPALGAT